MNKTNGEKFLEKMSDVDETLIVEAEKKPKRKRLFIGAGVTAVAAAAVIAVCVGVLSNKTVEKPPVVSGALGNTEEDTSAAESTFEGDRPPLIELNGKNIMPVTGGMGFEGIDVFDVSELGLGHPFNENMKLERMPVYSSESNNPDKEKMKALLLKTAAYFGLELTEEEIRSTLPDEDYKEQLMEQARNNKGGVITEEDEKEIERIYRMVSFMGRVGVDKNGIDIDVGTDYSVSVWFDEGAAIKLPEEYRFITGCSREQLEKSADYLLENYGDFMPMKNPVKYLDNEYNREGRNSVIAFYDAGESDAETILNYSTSVLEFLSDEAGNVDIIRYGSLGGCEKLGDYPIISFEEAKERFNNGAYLTTVPDDYAREDEIAYWEIIYRYGIGYDYVMPFYRILAEIEMPEGYTPNEEGRTTYGAYYVPAVREEYLNGIESFISFNGALIGENSNGSGLDKSDAQPNNDWEAKPITAEIYGLAGDRLTEEDFEGISYDENGDWEFANNSVCYLAEPTGINYNSIDNADIFDPETLTFNGNEDTILDCPTESLNFKPYKIGDTVCGLTVSSVYTEYANYDNDRICYQSQEPEGGFTHKERYFSDCQVSFDGSITMSGYLVALYDDKYKEGNIIGGDGGIYFIPDSDSQLLPVLGDLKNTENGIVKSREVEVIEESGFAFLNEYGFIGCGNVKGVTLPELQSLPQNQPVRAQVTVSDIIMRSEVDLFSFTECGIKQVTLLQ